MKLSFSCCTVSCCTEVNMPSQAILDAKVSQEEVVRIYDKLASVYDVWATLTESRARNRAIELAGITDGQDILEVAVGTGLAFYEIVKRNPHGKNTGIDLSTKMLKKAQNRLKRLSGSNYSLKTGTAFDIPMCAESVDLLINMYMLDLIPYKDMDKILLEFQRVLKKGGKLILVNMAEGETVGSKLYDLIYRLSPQAMGGCRGLRMSDKLKQHGFTVESREYYQQMFFPSEIVVAYKPV